ncbi:MAG TPA: pyridoxamine 5'-phosphate oxidase family protein [Roseiflexaceae bacterium]|nr:pyridoxamine 5'-phosphate oxidase family protein [Roseiflexaceae bacterium]
MSWRMLEEQNPELAAFGKQRLNGKVAYLATVRDDGSPRVHPVTPIVGEGRLFVFMEPTSPKGRDIQRDGRFALHCSVSDNSGESGEFYVLGRAQLVDSAEQRALAVSLSSYAPADRYILFEFAIDQAASTTYADSGPVRMRWTSER